MQTFINYNILITGIFLLIFSQIVDASSNIQNNITTDLHETEDQAKAVCRGLERTGLGGEGKHFPKRTWTENLADDIERIAKG